MTGERQQRTSCTVTGGSDSMAGEAVSRKGESTDSYPITPVNESVANIYSECSQQHHTDCTPFSDYSSSTGMEVIVPSQVSTLASTSPSSWNQVLVTTFDSV